MLPVSPRLRLIKKHEISVARLSGARNATSKLKSKLKSDSDATFVRRSKMLPVSAMLKRRTGRKVRVAGLSGAMAASPHSAPTQLAERVPRAKVHSASKNRAPS